MVRSKTSHEEHETTRRRAERRRGDLLVVREIKWVPNERDGRDLVLSAQRTASRGGTVTNRLVWRRLQDWDR